MDERKIDKLFVEHKKQILDIFKAMEIEDISMRWNENGKNTIT